MTSKPKSIPELLLKKHPEIQFGMVVYINMLDFQKWQRDRVLKARKAKPQKRFKRRK
jgi:hypothetical protein